MSRILTTSQKSAFQPLVTLGPVKPSRSFRFGDFEQTQNNRILSQKMASCASRWKRGMKYKLSEMQ